MFRGWLIWETAQTALSWAWTQQTRNSRCQSILQPSKNFLHMWVLLLVGFWHTRFTRTESNIPILLWLMQCNRRLKVLRMALQRNWTMLQRNWKNWIRQSPKFLQAKIIGHNCSGLHLGSIYFWFQKYFQFTSLLTKFLACE